MSHVSQNYVIESTGNYEKDKGKIWSQARSFAFYNTDRQENPDGRYHGDLTIHNNTVYNSYEEAENAIKRYDNGWYSDHAVKYRDTSSVDKPTSAMKKISEREKKLNADYRALNEKSRNDINEFKSNLISCKTCDSKINKKYVRYGCCPCCGTDMRSPTVLNRLNNMRERIAECQRSYEELRKELHNKNLKKAKICWLLKVEVHC